MTKLKKGFGKVFLIATIISLIFASCMQPSNEIGTENITVTVQKDSNVIKAPDSFTLEKGSKLGFTQLKEKISIEFKATYELFKIALINGEEITDTAPYTFNEDTTIVISSQKKGTGAKLQLTELKVDGNSIEIKDVMEAGKTREDKVLVEVKASPADAIVEFEPTLENSFWKLELGKKSLKLKVKKDSDVKEYMLNIERIDNDVPILKKIAVGGKVKEGAEILDEMVFTAPQTASEIEVSTETDPKDATITFIPELVGGKLQLTGNETTLAITVGTAPKTSSYTVKVKKLVPGSAILDTLFVYGGRKQGQSVEATKDQTDKIINGDDIVLELAGPKATILAASKAKTWTSFKINGVKAETFPYSTFTSVALEYIKLPAKGETMDVKIEVEDANDFGEFNFKIKRTDETVDVPVDRLYISSKNVLGKAETRTALHDGSKPQFDGGEPSNIEVESNENVMKSATIDSTNYDNVIQKVDADNNPIWSIGGVITGVEPSGKDVTIVVEPIDTDTYHSITWTLHLKYKAAEPLVVEYEINGKTIYDLDPSFVQDIKLGNNPTIELESKFLNVKLICKGEIANVKINEQTIQGDNLIPVGENYILTHSIPIETTAKQIDIKVTPIDTGAYSSVSFRFQAKGDGTTEKITPTFEEISGDRNLPKATFLDKLSGADKPLYKTVSQSADITIDLTEYTCDFLCKEVRINGKKAEIKVIKSFFFNLYKVKESIPVSENTPTDVKIEFIAHEGKSENLVWQFQVQGGGTPPSLPQSSVRIFKINGVGGFGKPLPKELTDHLTDGTNPTYEFDGHEALVEVGSYSDDLIENVIFKLDDVKKHEMAPVEENFANVAKYTFELPDKDAHKVEIVIVPKDKKYSDLIYSFNLKSSGKNPPLPLVFALNGTVRPTGHKETIDAESAELVVQARKDIMLTVKIGEKGSEEDCDIITFVSSDGLNIWEAKKNVSLLENNNAVEKTFVIKVIPKDSNKYEETICEYILTGKKIADTNAEFVWTGGQYSSPKVTSKVKWKAGLENNLYIDDYGSTAVTLEAHTVSPRAHVKYQIVDMKGNPVTGQDEHELTNTNGVHKSEEITLFADKPTRIKAWVIAADNTTTDDAKGVWHMTYNPVPLKWGYEDKNDGAEYTTEAYDEIEVERTNVKSDNKIYLVFAPWNEEDGYTVVNDDLPEGQEAFIKIGTLGNLQEYYKTAIDVSKLLDNSKPELTATLKMKRNNKDCLTYNVKIKLKS